MELKSFHDTRNPWQRFLGRVHGVLATTFLFSTLLGINVIQMSSMLVYPFSQRACRGINRWCANTWWGLCYLWGKYITGIKYHISGDTVPSKENAILVVNHQTMTDVPILFAFAHAHGRLGDLKWFVKDVIKYMPGVGWGMKFLDCLFIDRDWTADEDRVHRVFSKLLKNKVPAWIVIFAEGTRITPKKRERAQAYAAKQNRPPLENVLFPRTKGFVATVQGMGSHVDAIYDLTIRYRNGPVSLWPYTQGIEHDFYLHVKRTPINDLPQDEASLHEWLIDRFYEKDQRLEQGNFGAENTANA